MPMKMAFLAGKGKANAIRVEFGMPEVISGPGTDAHTAEVITDRMMRRVAALLPEANRGAYGAATEGTIVVHRPPLVRGDTPAAEE